ncbi:hypothetical protein [Mycobacterium sp. E1747]|uniref:hypothetical protein n=1 Tax=Mycobacterium sp. E1747 TaxID=1834128 RepID=UPI0008018651|nr:hypothetical protein [Mycobacterium sp. E1747]OBH08958.1 hypothetical protein A5695_25315 [Mycobacterium sp. E1747]
MSDRFRISKTDDTAFPWALDYPTGFDEEVTGDQFITFDNAVAAFIEAVEFRCPNCLRGAVIDTDWGWVCKNCGSSDVAVGCVAPADAGLISEVETP